MTDSTQDRTMVNDDARSPTSAPGPTPPPPTALFNGYIGASLAFAFVQIGLVDALQPGTKLTIDDLKSRLGCDGSRLAALLHTGKLLGYLVANEAGEYAWTDAGADLAKHAGYFTWLVGGYGKFCRDLGSQTREPTPWSHLRDGSMVALGSDQVNGAFMQEKLYRVLDRLEFSRVADLGCGNAGRLVEFCRRYPGTTGVGIDINRDAVDLALLNVAANGLGSSIDLHCQNVLEAVEAPALRASFAGVDVVTCFMMFHDLLNVSNTSVNLFARLRAAFPNVKYFVIADTLRMLPREQLAEIPIFNMGFELVHAFMDVEIHQKQTYDDAFIEAGLTIESCTDFGTPNTYLYVLRT